MKYTIWSIDDSRKTYTDQISSILDYEKIEVNCVNGRWRSILEIEFDNHNLHIFDSLGLQPGELGVWFTLINTLKLVVELNENLLVFEDDAMLGSNFMEEFESRALCLPPEFDFFSLFIPRDHDQWSKYEPEIDDSGLIVSGTAKYIGFEHNMVNNYIFKCWQRYGGVSMLWTPAGARKMLELIYSNPYKQWDEFAYANSRLGKLNGFTSNPGLSDLVYITGKEKSIVHE